MAKYRLIYFNVRALGEPVRYVLSYIGKEWEDYRLPGELWAKTKNLMPFGKLPILEINSEPYYQSAALCRFLAHEANLIGKNPLENMKIDQAVGAFNDLTTDIGKMFNLPDSKHKQNMKKIILSDTLPFYMEKFEDMLQKNNGYLANSKLSWADLYMVAYSESVPHILGIELEQHYPNFRKLKNTVQSLPGITEWINTRPEYIL